jgi:quinohemoprotein ethanol dehydrogenase
MNSSGLLRQCVPSSLVIILSIILTNCENKPSPASEAHIKNVTSTIDDAFLVNADDNPDNWVTYGKNYAEDRFSPLNEINKDNAGKLGLAWSLNLETTRGIEATPLVMDGIMFVSGPWSKVFAIDARNGKLIWTYDPKVHGKWGEKACCDVVNRGLALYKGRVYVGTIDGRLVAIDASTGTPVWQVQTTDTTKNYTITGAPRIVKGNVVIGNGGADLGVRGYVTAYDAMTGEQRWRFYTVPGDPSKPFESKAMETAAKTWEGDWWKYGGGGTAWDAMAYDPELNLLYIGTGNGSPWDWFHRSNGKGDNLYLSSIVAVNADNGEMVWYYQTTPGDHWDYTATQHLLLADLNIDGKETKVIMQAPKNGFFYVLDRKDGKLLSAKPYTYMNWATSVDMASGRPVETDFSRYQTENVVIAPGPSGGHSWQPMAFNPETKLVYIPVHYNHQYVYGHDGNWKYSARGWNTATNNDPSHHTRNDDKAPPETNQGRLIAWDPVKQQEVWKVDHPATFWNGGVLTTAGGLVFQGTAEGKFVAYDAANGNKVWEANVGSGVIASPVAYGVDGKQYISIAVGWGGVVGIWNRFTDQVNPGTVYTFALDEKAAYPEFPKTPVKELIKLEYKATKEEISNGGELFNANCTVCHELTRRGGVIPGLGYASAGTFDIFEKILSGMYLSKGMPDFSDRFSKQQMSDIKNFILYSAEEERGKK